MLDALPQPVVLATSAASYLVAPAAGRRVTAWLEYPAARATSPDAAARRRANRLVIANRDGRARAGRLRRRLLRPRSRATRSPRRSPAPTPCSTPSPTAGTPTSRRPRCSGAPSRLVAQMAQPAGGARRRTRWPAPRPSGTPRGALRARPPDISAPARTLVDAPTGGTVRAVARREPVTAWLGAHGDRAGRGLRAARRRAASRRSTRETRPGVRLTALALLDGGRVAVVAMRTRRRRAHRERAARDAAPARARGARRLGALAARRSPTARRSRPSARAWRSGAASAPSAGWPTRSS